MNNPLNPSKVQLDFLQDMDEDLDLDDIPEMNASNTESESSEPLADDSNNEAAALDAAELDKVTGALGTPDADSAPVVDPAVAPQPVAETPPVASPEPVAAVAAAPVPAVVESQAQPTPTPAASPDDITKVYSDWRSETEDLLAKHHYKLSEEDMIQIDSNPQEALPRMMARVYMDAVSAAITQVLTYLPQTMRQVTEQERINNESESAFFSKWPALKEKKEAVLSIGQVYRQMNPRATAEQFINEVGAAAMMSLRLDPSQGTQPAAPIAASPQPFVPAAQTPQGGILANQKPVNQFTALNEEFDRWEEELD